MHLIHNQQVAMTLVLPQEEQGLLKLEDILHNQVKSSGCKLVGQHQTSEIWQGNFFSARTQNETVSCQQTTLLSRQPYKNRLLNNYFSTIWLNKNLSTKRSKISNQVSSQEGKSTHFALKKKLIYKRWMKKSESWKEKGNNSRGLMKN